MAVQLEELAVRAKALNSELIRAETAASDIRVELTKAEGDVAQVRDRAARDQQRLDAGVGGHKELASLQHELESLARRQEVLEDLELEVMERLETVSTKVNELTTEKIGLASQLESLQVQQRSELGELLAERDTLLQTRQALVAAVDEALYALYEKVRAGNSGIGAALLRARCCDGCRMQLSPQIIQQIRSAAPETVIRCEECLRILIRTDESGL